MKMYFVRILFSIAMIIDSIIALFCNIFYLDGALRAFVKLCFPNSRLKWKVAKDEDEYE